MDRSRYRGAAFRLTAPTWRNISGNPARDRPVTMPHPAEMNRHRFARHPLEELGRAWRPLFWRRPCRPLSRRIEPCAPWVWPAACRRCNGAWRRGQILILVIRQWPGAWQRFGGVGGIAASCAGAGRWRWGLPRGLPDWCHNAGLAAVGLLLALLRLLRPQLRTITSFRNRLSPGPDNVCSRRNWDRHGVFSLVEAFQHLWSLEIAVGHPVGAGLVLCTSARQSLERRLIVDDRNWMPKRSSDAGDGQGCG